VKNEFENISEEVFPHLNSFVINLIIVFARSNTAIVGSNPTGGMDVCSAFEQFCN
jgi:hypothetical protein